MMVGWSLLLAGLAAILPAKDTVWWHTGGGKVVEQKNATDAQCTLTLYDADTAIDWTWEQGQPLHAFVVRREFRFDKDTQMGVAVQIGATWLRHGDGSPNMLALGRGMLIAFLVDPPIDDLLARADHITVKAENDTFTIRVERSKMVLLIRALRKCRRSIHL